MESSHSKLCSRLTDSLSSNCSHGFTEFNDEARTSLPPVEQVVVRTHFGSGRKTLYLSAHASHIVGWPVPEGRLLLHDLTEHAIQRQFVYSHRWRVGDLVISLNV